MPSPRYPSVGAGGPPLAAGSNRATASTSSPAAARSSPEDVPPEVAASVEVPEQVVCVASLPLKVTSTRYGGSPVIAPAFAVQNGRSDSSAPFGRNLKRTSLLPGPTTPAPSRVSPPTCFR